MATQQNTHARTFLFKIVADTYAYCIAGQFGMDRASEAIRDCANSELELQRPESYKKIQRDNPHVIALFEQAKLIMLTEHVRDWARELEVLYKDYQAENCDGSSKFDETYKVTLATNALYNCVQALNQIANTELSD